MDVDYCEDITCQCGFRGRAIPMPNTWSIRVATEWVRRAAREFLSTLMLSGPCNLTGAWSSEVPLRHRKSSPAIPSPFLLDP